MKLKPTSWRLIIFGVVVGIIITLFQNCGKDPLEFTDSYVSSNLNYFGYAYKSEPEFYFDLKVIPQEVSGNYRNIYIVGGVTAATESAAVFDYQVEILDTSGNRMCPIMQGTLSQGATLIKSTCVTLVSMVLDQVISRIYYNGKWHEFTQNLSSSY